MASTVVSPTRWDQAIEKFLEFMEIGLMASNNTLLAYKADLVQMESIMAPWGVSTFSEVTESHLHHYIQMLKDNGAKSATVARKATVARRFFSFIFAKDPFANPAKDLYLPPIRTTPADTLSEEQLNELLSVCMKGRFPRRDEAIVQLAAISGTSPSEIAGLQLRDYLASESSLFVGKGERRRQITLTEECSEPILSYLSEERGRIQNSRRSSSIFLNFQGTSLTRSGVWLIVKERARRTSIPNCSPRQLRATAIRRMRTLGVTDEVIRETIGLADVSALRRYR